VGGEGTGRRGELATGEEDAIEKGLVKDDGANGSDRRFSVGDVDGVERASARESPEGVELGDS
jgi:hypothetical protein